MAELWGVLHRLHREGLKICSLERLDGDPASRSRGEPPAGQEAMEVRIDVDGVAAELLSTLLSCVEAYENPASTTIVLRLAGEDELFEALHVVESLALNPRGIRVRT